MVIVSNQESQDAHNELPDAHNELPDAHNELPFTLIAPVVPHDTLVKSQEQARQSLAALVGAHCFIIDNNILIRHVPRLCTCSLYYYKFTVSIAYSY